MRPSARCFILCSSSSSSSSIPSSTPMIFNGTFHVRQPLHHAAALARKSLRFVSFATTRQQSDERLRILFCGSETFSAFSLRALAKYARSPHSKIDSLDVVTRKDKLVGRGLKQTQSPLIKRVAEELELPLHQIDTFTGWSPPSYSQVANYPSAINLIIAVSFGLLVPPRILRGAAYGGLNVHPSLLPQFKGAAPIHWTILHGLKTTGVSLQTLHESKFDEGIVLDRISVPVEHPDTCTFQDLRNQLGPIGADLLIKGLQEKRYITCEPMATTSEPGCPSYAPKIQNRNLAIDPQVHGSRQMLRMQRACKVVWAHAQNLNGKLVRVVTDSIATNDIRIPQFIMSTASSIQIGVPFGIVKGGKSPATADRAPLYMNTLDGLLAINTLLVSGSRQGDALAAAARGRFLKHYTSVESPAGELWDVYTFCAPLRGEADGLPAFLPEADNAATE